jgi:hypothetical protein
VPWVEVFSVFVVCHLVGDYLFQTDWEAAHKMGGLGPDRLARRALLTHVATYTLAYVPAFIWLADDLGAGVLLVAALVAGPHVVQDDGRLVDVYLRRVKRCDPESVPGVRAAVDQAFHFLALFALAIVAGN